MEGIEWVGMMNERVEDMEWNEWVGMEWMGRNEREEDMSMEVVCK